MLKGVSPKNVVIVGFVRSLLSMLYLSVHHVIPRDNFLEIFGFTPDAFEAFCYDSIFDQAMLCLGKNKVCQLMMNVIHGIILKEICWCQFRIEVKKCLWQ